MKSKPRCRYNHFKYCPEKPFYVRKEYPFGEITNCNEDGCMNWHIEFLHDLTTGKDSIHQGCIDIFTAFYLREYGIRALGNQRATEQLRNGLCEEIGDKIYPKINPIEKVLVQAIQSSMKELTQIKKNDTIGS